MSTALLTRYAEERQTLTELIDNTLGRAEAEQRDLVAAEIESLEVTGERLSTVDAEIKRISELMDRRNAAIDLNHVISQQNRKRDDDGGAHRQQSVPSFGDFVNSQEFRSYQFAGASDRMLLNARVTETRAPLTTGADPGKVFLPAAQKLMVPQGLAEFPLLNALTRIPVDGNSVEMVVYGEPKGAKGAKVVPEGTKKPEATLTASSVPVTLETQAYWVEVTRQLMQDAPAFRAFVEEQLRTGLLAKLETDAITAIEAGTYNVVTQGADVLESIRYGIADVQMRGFRPNAILTDPMTAAMLDIQLLKILQGFGGSPWLTPIPVAGMTPGKVLVGDFSKSAAFLERSATEVYVSDSGVSGDAAANFKDRFTHNLFVILAETRAKTVVVQPQAVSEVKVKTTTTNP